MSGALGQRVLTGVGLLEVGIALWILSGWAAHCCAAVQTIALLSMNAIELTVARPLLLWPAGLIPVNLLFLISFLPDIGSSPRSRPRLAR